MKYPELKKIPHEENWFGEKLEDPYFWIRDAKNPELLQWVKEENEFTDAWFDPDEVAGKEAELKAERPRELYMNISEGRETSDFLISTNEGDEYVIKETDSDFQNETVVMKRNDIPDFTVFDAKYCPCDHRLAAFEGSFAGDPRLSVLIKDMDTGEILFRFGNVFSYAWSNSSRTMYFAPTETDVKQGKTVTSAHAWNADSHKDTVLFTDSAIIGEVHVGKENHIIFEMMDDYSHSRFFRLDEKTGAMTEMNTVGGQYVYIDTIDGNDYFIARESTSNGEILKVPGRRTMGEAQHFRKEGTAVIEFAFAQDGKLYLGLMDHVCSRLIEVSVDGSEREIALPEKMGTLSVCGTAYGNTYLIFQSFLNAGTMLKLVDGNLEVVLSVDSKTYADLIVEQKYVPSTGDGTLIPYFIVHRKDAKLDCSNPLWMYAYGGYNVAMRPEPFEEVTGMRIAEWVEKGRVFVLGSIRGGSEFGTAWHQQGMAKNKRKCYEDFIGIAEKLIADGWTSTPHFVISGMSNGGLLMSTLVTMRPDLFGCVIDSVPHADMIHFADDDRGPMYVTEYGNPRESKEMFDYLLSYSPYYNVRRVNYPPVFIQTGECDNNVPPYHGKKFAAKMQQMNTSDNPILLRVLKDGSHNRGVGGSYWQTVGEMHVFVEHALKLY